MDMDAWSGLLTGRQRLLRQAAAFMAAWEAATPLIGQGVGDAAPNAVGAATAARKVCQRSDAGAVS
jgi:hypothetical protein